MGVKFDIIPCTVSTVVYGIVRESIFLFLLVGFILECKNAVWSGLPDNFVDISNRSLPNCTMIFLILYRRDFPLVINGIRSN